ncbi:hypothetical protein EDC94DRAFT_601771 [Helicostylum pulchrum]|nr:hypothetical protein EDC94DRAFT_601771 [Helicostylum pulchrum]
MMPDIEQSPTPPVLIKEEPIINTLPISPTTERMSRLKVMTIGFLCGSDEEEEPALEERRASDCPLLDLLVDAVMDAEYLNVQEKKAAAAAAAAATAAKKKLLQDQQQITVVVNPDIHRDAANRILLQQQQQQQQQQKTLPASPTSDSKADSAVSLSPRLITKNEDRCWRREMDDGLFNKQQDDEEEENRALDDFFDDVSDLSSVSSSWSSDEEEEEEEEVPAATKSIASSTTKKQTKTVTPTPIQDLTCIACARPLKKQDISEQVGADMSITNELATWTWSPSAIFTDWRPKRCPRCERHFTIFKQEWPNRKIKKKKMAVGKKSRKPPKKSNSPVKKLSSQPFPAQQPQPQTKVEEHPSTPVYQIQDDPEDLNYIPPSPLSDVVYDDDEDHDTFS